MTMATAHCVARPRRPVSETVGMTREIDAHRPGASGRRHPREGAGRAARRARRSCPAARERARPRGPAAETREELEFVLVDRSRTCSATRFIGGQGPAAARRTASCARPRARDAARSADPREICSCTEMNVCDLQEPSERTRRWPRQGTSSTTPPTPCGRMSIAPSTTRPARQPQVGVRRRPRGLRGAARQPQPDRHGDAGGDRQGDPGQPQEDGRGAPHRREPDPGQGGPRSAATRCSADGRDHRRASSSTR